MIDTEESKDLVEGLGVDLVPCFHFYKGPGTRKDYLADFEKENLEAQIIEKIKAVSESENHNESQNIEKGVSNESLRKICIFFKIYLEIVGNVMIH